MVDYLFPCDIDAFVTIQEALMRLRTIDPLNITKPLMPTKRK